MDEVTRAAEREALGSLADSATLARLAGARRRGGDAAGARAAALAALSHDSTAPVRDLVPPPPAPAALGLDLSAPWPAPREPLRVRSLVGPALAGRAIVDIGRGLAAYASSEGLLAMDLFGAGVVWHASGAAPWGVHAGRLVTTGEGGSALGFLDPATGERCGPSLRPGDLGLAGDSQLRPLAVDDRQLAILGRSRRPGSDALAFVDLDGRVQLIDVPPLEVRPVAAASRSVVVLGGRTTTGRLGAGEASLIAVRPGGIVWTALSSLLGVVGPDFATVTTSGLDGTVIRRLRAADGAVVGDSESRLWGLDRRTWSRMWSWAPPTVEQECTALAFADLLVVALERHDALPSGPTRRALALLALDPVTGEQVWRVDFDRALPIVGGPIGVAGAVVLPTWRAAPVVVEATGRGVR
jgi:hypothetical protein